MSSDTFSISSFHSSIIIVDPTAEEESLSTALMTVVTDEKDRLCAVHKPGKQRHLTQNCRLFIASGIQTHQGEKGDSMEACFHHGIKKL